MTEKQSRIMTMDVLINAQRARIELSSYANQKQKYGVIPKHEIKDIGHSYACLNKIIKELSDELDINNKE